MTSLCHHEWRSKPHFTGLKFKVYIRWFIWIFLHYDVVQYDMILYLTLQWLRHNINWNLYTKDTPQLALMGESWRVYCVEFPSNYHVTMKPHCSVGCRYNMVQYDMISHMSLELPRHNIDQSVNPQDTPYLALKGELWGVFCEDFQENWPRYNSTALYSCYCTW